MEMSCEGCSNAAKRVLGKIGVTEVEADLTSQKLFVTSDKSHTDLLAALQKTGKKVEYLGVSS
jgi:copper chaperone